MNPKIKFPEKIQNFINEGNLGRAREVIDGHLANSGYNTEILEQYGNILLLMGDKVNAGKYLFLSDKRNDYYSESINLFLKRYGKNGYKNLLHSFPKYIKRLELSQFPDNIRQTLIDDGMPCNIKMNKAVKNLRNPTSNYLMTTGCLIVILIVLIIFGIGLFHSINYLIQ